MSDVIDWGLARAAGARWVPSGPEASIGQAQEIVADIRTATRAAIEPVRRITGLHAPEDAHRAVVVARAEWVRANVDQMRVAVDPLSELLREKAPNPVIRAAGARASALQMGAILAWLSSKVLGQFEAFDTPGAPAGRLLLVAPNIVAAERALEVPEHDFRLWVCLHEETHRVQFTAVPWLSEYFTTEVHAYLRATDTDTASLLRRILSARRDAGGGLLDVMHTPEQREILDRLTALMSLLEGHADVVMDEVGPDVVPSVATIRERFDKRRGHHRGLDALLRRVLGLDAKLRQYIEGAAFVRGVVDRTGMAGFNEIWTSPSALPSLEEISEPAAWVRRVLG